MTMSHIRKKAIAGLKPGDSFTVSRTFTEQDMLAFADLSRDYNPVHFDDRFADAKNFRGRICHGLLVASLATEIGGQINNRCIEKLYIFRDTRRNTDKAMSHPHPQNGRTS